MAIIFSPSDPIEARRAAQNTKKHQTLSNFTKAEPSTTHRYTALYQGTTLVGPLEGQPRSGLLAPALFSLPRWLLSLAPQIPSRPGGPPKTPKSIEFYRILQKQSP